MSKRHVFYALLLCLCAISFSAQAQRTFSGQPIRVQLKWYHQFQFAGFYAAQAQGYFAEAGLNVELIEGGPTKDPATAVANGEAEFGVGNSTLIIDRYNGNPLVAVTAIFQHSPFVILARRDDTLAHVRDLEGRTLMVEEHAAELFAYLKLAGVDLDKVEIVPHTGNVHNLAIDDPSGIDATTAYTSTEPYDAIQAEIPYRIFNPRDINIDFYGDLLFTSEAFATKHADVVNAMRKAVIKGWAYARINQDEIITLIMERYNPHLNRLQMGFEAQAVHDLLASDFVDLGYMSTSRWRHIANVFAEAGMLPQNVSLDGFIFDSQDEVDARLYRWVAFLSISTVLALLIAHRFYRLNGKLRSEITQRTALQAELEELATTDPLSGLANRRRLVDWAEIEFARARRLSHDLALILIDLDNFKSVNDRWGHTCGDRCIKAVAAALKKDLRTIDLAARLGGDEFGVLLPETSQDAAENVVSRLRQTIDALEISCEDGQPVTLRASFGLDFLQDDDRSIDDLTARADANMYADKAART